MHGHGRGLEDEIGTRVFWHDIDAELGCSTREVCIGYSGFVPDDSLAVLRRLSHGADGREHRFRRK
jgi:hypothetical protein